MSVESSPCMCASVLSVSTSTLASSFCSPTAFSSWSRTFFLRSLVCWMVFCAAFSAVICSESLASMSDDSSCSSLAVRTYDWSIALTLASSCLASVEDLKKGQGGGTNGD